MTTLRDLFNINSGDTEYELEQRGIDPDIAEYILDHRDEFYDDTISDLKNRFFDIETWRNILDIPGKSKYKIGAKFSFGEILEYKSDNLFIPSSYSCVEKVLKQKCDLLDKPYIPPAKDKPYGISLIMARKRFLIHGFPLDPLIPYFPSKHEDKIKWRYISNINKKIPNSLSVALVVIKENLWHAVLVNPITFSPNNVLEYVKQVEKGFNFEVGFTPIYNIRKKNKDDKIFIYDIETYSDNTENGSKQIPFAICYASINDLDNVFLFEGDDCVNRFLNHAKEGQYFAHNGSKFDAILIMGNITDPKLRITQILGDINCIKKMTIKRGNNLIVLKDSLSFTPGMSLSKLCKSFNVIKSKFEFDIKGKSKEWYIKHSSIPMLDELDDNSVEDREFAWKTYLKRDVVCLGLALMEVEKCFNTLFQESITTSVGIPGISYKVLIKQLRNKTLQVPKDEDVRKFIRSSIYGGRVLHFKTKGENLICLDANSLYPSAQYEGQYPIGECKEMSITIFNNIILEKRKLFIAEVTMDGKNCKYPIMPYKNEEGMLVYPCGIFRGVYTCIDIYEALAAGYEIKEYHMGIYWDNKARIFEVIKGLYETRKKFKREKNSAEYIFKIMLNAGYGKFVEKRKKGIKFSTSHNEINKPIKAYKLKNGQEIFLYPPEQGGKEVPAFIGAFILSYSKRIMNKFMDKIGLENIYYGDTDSIYVDSRVKDKLKDYYNSDLGGLKNDYGDDTIIVKALFADYKRYYLKIKTDHGIKEVVKFNGLHYKGGDVFWYNCIKGEINDKTTSDMELLFEKLLNGDLIAANQTRWVRTNGEITIKDNIEYFNLNRNKRGEWKDNKFYTLDYNKLRPQLDWNYIDYEQSNKSLCGSLSQIYGDTYHNLLSLHRPIVWKDTMTSLKNTKFYKKGEKVFKNDIEFTYIGEGFEEQDNNEEKINNIITIKGNKEFILLGTKLLLDKLKLKGWI